MKIILCSGSPRRRELLDEMGYEFEVDTRTGFDEEAAAERLAGLPVHEYVSELAYGKNIHFHRPLEADEVLVTADTIVVQSGRIYGKPHSRDEAIAMIRDFAGAEHKVLTALCVRFASGRVERVVSESSVRFTAMSEAEIEYYVDTFKPFDKAGAYGIQEWIGLRYIEAIEGSFYTIMGLDTCALNKIIKNNK